jgi:hypothetical protein
MAAFPTAAQLSAYGTAGPWSSRTRAGALSNAGYSEGRYALATLSRIGFAPPVVWIDVEPRPAQPWPTGSQRENIYVIEGLMRALRDAGRAYGLYSYTSAWSTITGSLRLPGVPVWATAGRLDYPTEASDRCVQPSFSGGHVYLAQWYDDTRDYDLTCGSYGFTPLAVPPSSLYNSTAEFDGDWNNDVLARLTSGDLLLYRGLGNGSLAAGVKIGGGWHVFNALETVGDFTGDGAADVIARRTADGSLWLYPGNGRGGWLLPARQIGTGWNVMNALIGPNDFNGDQRPDLLARQASTGDLWLYPGNGAGGFAPRIKVGGGWNSMNALIGVGDFNGDGPADVLARQASTGDLWLYPGNGKGGWLPRVRVGGGWNSFNALLSPGDLNGDRTADVLARETSTGRLWLYPGNGAGGWLPRVLVGGGWNVMSAIF